MTEPLRPKENQNNSGDIARCDKKPKYEWQKYHWFDPAGLCELICREIEDYTSRKTKRDYYTSLIRRYFVPVVFAVFSVIVCGLTLFQIGFFEPNVVIAVFTFVLAMVAGVQWWSSHGLLKQARITSQQTGKQLRFMMDRERGRLTSTRSSHVYVIGGQSPDCEFNLKNIGYTLVYIEEAIGGLFFVREGERIDDAQLYPMTRWDSREEFIRQECEASYRAHSLKTLTEEDCRDFERKVTHIVIVARFKYADVFERRHYIESRYTYHCIARNGYRWGGSQRQWSEDDNDGEIK